ncbi:uncharacterized protein LOC105440517 [Strongylocentrotus purpuratus]|uniref:Uncharacterized protein n=1 Tax=Strongylocentrotus purpuratus TaxID=7668 RepID=A0A7M7HLP9_STRPU|nr:uncharacterized protein LOC105440517 [Strongylocentrotus purpuratus]|eukprot:XP_011669070.1 PREDICTED: uncharacterized protein LOC105440517 [Strongylocentrotus purpuratus]
MVHTTNLVAAAAAVTTVFLLLGAGPAEAQQGPRNRYCGLEFARAVFTQCSMANKRSDPGAVAESASAARYLARDTGYEQAEDMPLEWYDVARQGAERLRPSLTDIIFSSRFRRSIHNRGQLPMGQLCCVYGCTLVELASVCT